MIWNKKIETMERKEMETLQLKKLQELTAYVYDKVPFTSGNLIRQGLNLLIFNL